MDVPALSGISYFPLFNGLPPECLQRVAAQTDKISFEPGQQVLAEGEAANVMYMLQKGKVVLSARSPGRGQLLVQTLGPGEVLGLSWLFPPYQWQFDAHAVERVEALAVEAKALHQCMSEDPAFGYQILLRLLPVMLERLQQTRVRLLDLYAKERPTNGGPTR